jgi:hypothetical protein
MEKTRYRKIYYSQYLVVILVLAALIGLALLSHWVMQQMTYEDQFLLPWAAGRAWLLEGVDPYDGQVLRLARITLANLDFRGQLPEVTQLTAPFLNLVFSLIFSLIPYEIARTAWLVLLEVSLAASGFFLLKLSNWKTSFVEKAVVILLMMSWLPSLQLVLEGSLTPLVIFLIFAGVYSLLKGKETLAGFLLALTFGSIQITFLVLTILIIWSIFHRRGATLVAYFSGLAFLWIISLILLPSWPAGWLGVLLEVYTNFSWVHTPLMDLAGLLPGISNYLSIALHAGFAIYLVATWISSLNRSNKEPTWRLLALLNLAYLFQLENTAGSLMLTLPALFLAFRYWSERWHLVGRLLSWLSLLLISVLPWLVNDLPDVFTGNVPFTGLVIGLPLLSVFGMISVRWWATNIPKLSFGDQK